MVYKKTEKVGLAAENFRREITILNIVNSNPNISKRALMRLVGGLEPKYRMSPELVRAALDRLLNRKILHAEKRANRIVYTVRDPNTRVLQRILDKELDEMEMVGRAIKRDISTFPKIKKNTVLIHYIQALTSLQGCIICLKHSSDYFETTKEQERIDSLHKLAYSLLNKLGQAVCSLALSVLDNDFVARMRQAENYFTSDEVYYKNMMI